MKFANIEYLYLLPILIVIFTIFLVLRYKKYNFLLKRFIDSAMFGKVVHRDVIKIYKITDIIFLLIFLFFIVSLSGPQWGLVPKEVKVVGADIIFAIDVSKSMLVEDVEPNRLELVKKIVSLLLDRVGANRVGIITFAGISFYQCPLTLDISSAKYFLSFVDTDSVPFPGTKIGDCIAEAIRVFKQYSRTTKVLIIFTDGEDHDSSVSEQIDEARKNGVIIYTVGVGTSQGRPIPIRNDYGQVIDYKKDKKGNIITSRLNEKLLIEIARATSGKYFSLSYANLSIVDFLTREIGEIKKGELKSKMYNIYINRYHYFVYLLIILFLTEIFIPKDWLIKIF